MNARIFIATLGIFITLIVLTYGCSADRSYRDEYRNLLEEKLSNQSPVPAEATIVEELSDEKFELKLLIFYRLLVAILHLSLMCALEKVPKTSGLS